MNRFVMIVLLFSVLFSCKQNRESEMVKSNDITVQTKTYDILDVSNVSNEINRVFAEYQGNDSSLFFITDLNNIKSKIVGEVWIFSVDNNMNLISSVEARSASSDIPYLESSAFSVFGFFDRETYLSDIIVFNKKNGTLKTINLDVKFISFLKIIDNVLFLYKEQSDNSISEIDLSNYKVIDLPGYFDRVQVQEIDGNVILYDFSTGLFFRIIEDKIIPFSEDLPKFEPVVKPSFTSLLVKTPYSLFDSLSKKREGE